MATRYPGNPAAEGVAAAKRDDAMRAANREAPTRSQAIDGYRMQPLLPIRIPYLGIEILSGEFRRYPSEPETWYVEAETKIGTLGTAYTIVLSIPQALDADIIERV
jgi:hypothetical protein